MKRIFLIIKISLVVLIGGLIAGILNNNFGDSSYSKEDIQSSLNHSIDWLVNNRETILNDQNSMLWWMLIQAAEVSHDTRLTALVDDFKSRYANDYRYSPWSYLITGEPSLRGFDASVENLPDYNIYFIYSYSCSYTLGALPIVQTQHETGFCWSQHPVSPACTTHQLMGYRFMQRTQCNELSDLTDRIDAVSKYIRYQSMLDFRVVDVYLQRVLMQYDSGFSDRVNPRWVKRILSNQHADGGWGDFQTLIPLGNNAIGFSGKILGFGQATSSYHATAQGVWLMAMLNQQ